jgi:hypothetical protein
MLLLAGAALVFIFTGVVIGGNVRMPDLPPVPEPYLGPILNIRALHRDAMAKAALAAKAVAEAAAAKNALQQTVDDHVNTFKREFTV